MVFLDVNVKTATGGFDPTKTPSPSAKSSPAVTRKSSFAEVLQESAARVVMSDTFTSFDLQ